MEPLLIDSITDFEMLMTNPQIRRFFLKTDVNVLIVVDRGIRVDSSAGFDLGKVIDIIQSNEFFPSARFKIQCAHRDVGTPTVNSSATSHQFRFTYFRFDMSGFNINDYDQVWFFGFNPGNNGSTNDGNINAVLQSPLSTNELKIVAQWMDTRGGGVLAMGDHHYLGASMCSKIPRVRNMRRWTNAQGVPTIGGFTRHDTNQPASYSTTIPFGAQGDNVPQPIEVLQKVYSAPVLRKNYVPHPILCGVDGVINVLPDHPHEGETLGVRYDTGAGGIPVNTSLTTGITGYNVAEYPAGIDGNPKPVPEIIAFGHPINDPRHEKNQRLDNPSHSNENMPFGLISVYDGEKAGVGRVVVDATWHHWFNENLTGFSAGSAHYRKIRNYFKNVAIWLCRKQLRSNIIFCSIWDYLVVEFDPMHFSVSDSIWYLGQQARDVLGRIATQCTRSEWILDHIFIEQQNLFRFPPEPTPCLTCPPFEALEIAILGGVMKSLYPLVEEYRLDGATKRVKMDVKEIASRAWEGVRLGQQEYMKAFEASKKMSDHIAKELPNAFKHNNGIEFMPRVDKRRLRIEVDSILFADEYLVYLLNEGNYKLDFDMSVNGVAIEKGVKALQKGEVKFTSPKSANKLAIATLRKPLYEGYFEEGEELLIELFLVYNDAEQLKRTLLWSFRFEGQPSTWLGKQQAGFIANGTGVERVKVILDVVESNQE